MADDMPSRKPDPGPAGSPPPGAGQVPLALYRKYRPATFAELKGQDHVTEPLRQALRSGRVHHAYLFSGPRGCGKTSSARILARSLNCELGPTPDPCGKCASCIALGPAGPGSIDVIEIDAASHGGVDDARDLRERAFYAPVAGRFKIYIVDEAHMVTGGGFNALLKLVEEPPPHLKFVFATTEPEKVIPTIRSRTHHYPFRLVPPAVLRGLLEQILASEGVAYESAVLPVVIRAAAGSVRDALSVLDQLIAGSDESGLSYERAVALLGYTDDALLDDVVAAFAACDGAAVFHAVDRVVEGGHDPRRFAADLLDRFRDLIVLHAVPDAGSSGLLDVPADRLDRMREQAAKLGPTQLTKAAETISAGLVEMRGATSPRLLLELMCAQVLLPAPGSAPQDVLARVERLERRLGPGGGVDQSAEPASAEPAGGAPAGAAPADADSGGPASGGAGPGASRSAASGTTDAQAVRQQWPAVLDAVRLERRVAWLLLNNATVESLADGVLTLRFSKEGEARGFAISGHDRELGQVLQAMFGISPRIQAVAGPPPQGTAPSGDRAQAGRPANAGGQDAVLQGAGPRDGAAHAEDAGDKPAVDGADARDVAAADDAEPRGSSAPDDAAPAARSADGARSARQAGRGRRAGPASQSGGQPARSAQPKASQLAGADAADSEPGALTGMGLVERELGGRIIEEIGED